MTPFFVMAKGKRTSRLKLLGFIPSTNLVVCSSCLNYFILRVLKILKSFVSFPNVLHAGLLLCKAVYSCSGATSVCTEAEKNEF